MQLSDLCRELEECLDGFGDVPLSVGSVTGAWLAMTGIEAVAFEGADIAAFSAGPGSYRRSGLRAKAVLDQARGFLRERGDMQAAVLHQGVLHTFVHLDVDDDIDEDGYPVSVAVLQAYAIKPRLSAL